MSSLINLVELVFRYIATSATALQLTPSERMVLLYLAHRSRWNSSGAYDRGESYPSLQRIGAETGVGKSAASRTVAKLADRGLVDIIRGGGRVPNVYRVNEAMMMDAAGVVITDSVPVKALPAPLPDKQPRVADMATQGCQTGNAGVSPRQPNYKGTRNKLTIHSEGSSSGMKADPEVRSVIAEWNETAKLTDLSQVSRVTEKLAMTVRRSIEANGLDAVMEAVRSPRESDFLAGTADVSFRWNGATLYWVLDDDHIANIVSGKYYNKRKKKKKSSNGGIRLWQVTDVNHDAPPSFIRETS